jgi:hypothetical protein
VQPAFGSNTRKLVEGGKEQYIFLLFLLFSSKKEEKNRKNKIKRLKMAEKK